MTTSTVAIREMRPGEAGDVGALIVAAYDATGPFDGPYRDHLADPTRWADGTTAVWVAVGGDGRLQGTVAFVLPGDREFESACPAPGDAGFRFLAVSPAVQGRGVGAALVDRCVTQARARGCHRVAIHSMEFMTAAHGLYRRLGFVRRADLDVRFPTGVGYGFTLDLTPDAPSRFPPAGPRPEPVPWFQDVWTGGDATPC